MHKLLATLFYFVILSIVNALPDRLRDRIGDWKTLHERNFNEWSIISCSYGGTIADGGSYIFEFMTSAGVGFYILAACSEILTDEERESGKQVFYLLEDSDGTGEKYFKISIQSQEEKVIGEMLAAALAGGKAMPGEDREMLEKLIHHLNSREIFYVDRD